LNHITSRPLPDPLLFILPSDAIQCELLLTASLNKPPIHSKAGSSVGIATDCRLVGIGVQVPVGAEIFFHSTFSRPALGSTQHPIQRVPWALSPGVKRSVREAAFLHRKVHKLDSVDACYS
jgi:hypothetical protein